ncbi:MAG: hypothetical protein K0R71_1213 [Bacillales bacterium]|jgi:hypothetical protein|nr:hypothetical protein [Bacillales bacterium]
MDIQHIKSLINPDFSNNVELSIRKNNGSYDSIVINSPATPYRESLKDILFAKYKRNGKYPYISFSIRYQNDFRKIGLQGIKLKSDLLFIRYRLDDFLSVDKVSLSSTLNSIVIDSFNFTQFGCCYRYKECSNEKKCIHPDMPYSTSCQYRKNLEQGRIFF